MKATKRKGNKKPHGNEYRKKKEKKKDSEMYTNSLACPKAYAEDVAKYVSWLKAVSD